MSTKASNASNVSKVTKSKKIKEPVVDHKSDTESEHEDKHDDKHEDDDKNEEIEESKKETFSDILDLIQDNQKEIRQKQLVQNQLITRLRRAHNIELRQQSTKKKNRKGPNDSGIMKPVPLPDEAKKFLMDIDINIPESGLMRRTELCHEIYAYIKSKGLYKPDSSKESGFDKTVIIPDAKIRKLFSLTADKTLGFSSLMTNIAKIYGNESAGEIKQDDKEEKEIKVTTSANKNTKKGKVASSSS